MSKFVFGFLVGASSAVALGLWLSNRPEGYDTVLEFRPDLIDEEFMGEWTPVPEWIKERL